MKQWVVEEKDSGSKLIAFLQKVLGQGYSAKQLKRAIENNHCQINGRTERFATTIVGSGDCIKLAIEKDINSTFEISILYEDDEFLIINKPSGHSSDSPVLSKAVQEICRGAELGHRLDKDTTGALIFAKHATAREELISLFRTHEVRKEYLALIDGIPGKSSGRIDNYLNQKHKYQGQAMWGSVKSSQGQHAITDWEILASGPKASLVLCRPITGRTHQLRVHLNEMDHPIIGDFQYGRNFRCNYYPTRFLLHAWKVSFKGISVEAPIPPEFKEGIKMVIGKWP